MIDDKPKRGIGSFFRSLSLKKNKQNGLAVSDDVLTERLVSSVSKKRIIPSWKQWKQLKRILSNKEWATFIIAISVVVVTATFLIGRYYVTHRVLVPAVGGEYTEGSLGNPQLVNPLYSSNNDVDADLVELLFSGLVKWDGKNGFIPDLAESFSISEDGKIYTFTLRDDAKWHDGEKIRVRDVLFTFQAIQDQDYKSPLAVSFHGVKTEQVDEQTLQFILDEPFNPFLSTLTVGILPAHLWSEVSPKNALLAELNIKPIGSGPYKFSKFTKDKKGNIRSYTLERFNDYYGNKVNIKEITFKYYSDFTELQNALENKNVEGVSFLPIDEEGAIARSLKIYDPSLPQVTAIFFNENNKEILGDEKMRKVLMQVTDKEGIVSEVLGGMGDVINAPILPGFIGYNPDIESVSYDLETAKSTLDDMEWDFIEGENRRIKGATSDDDLPENLKFTITTVDQPSLIKTAEIIKQQWNKAGINVEIDAVPAASFDEQVLRTRDYEVLLFGELHGADPDPYPFWHSSQIEPPGLNLAGYANRNADKLLDQARITTDVELREKSYREFQNLLAEDFAALFLYQPRYIYIVSDKIKSIELEQVITPANRFQQISKWFIKTKKKFSLKKQQQEQESKVTNSDSTAEVTPTTTETIKTLEEDTKNTSDEIIDSE